MVVRGSDAEDAGPGSDCDVEPAGSDKASLLSDEDVANRLDWYIKKNYIRTVRDVSCTINTVFQSASKITRKYILHKSYINNNCKH